MINDQLSIIHGMFLDTVVVGPLQENSYVVACEETKEAVIRRLEMAMDWEIFEEVRYRELWEILNHHGVNILDLSPLDPGRYGLRNLVTAVLMRFIFMPIEFLVLFRFISPEIRERDMSILVPVPCWKCC